MTLAARNSHPTQAGATRSVLRIVGMVLAALIVIAGLAMVATVILIWVAFSNYGSNK